MKAVGTDATRCVQSRLELPPAAAPSAALLAAADVGAIVLVHWQIRPRCEAEFLNHWQTRSVVRNRAGLVGEFLSEVVASDPVALPWITWVLAERDAVDAASRHFVNVGLWLTQAAFVEAIAGDFGDNAPMRPFELRRRRRLMLEPKCWRIGAVPLPSSDSAGVC